MCDNLDDHKREQIWYSDKNRKKNKSIEIKDERKEVLDNVQRCSMVDSFILTTPAFKINKKDFKSAIQEGPTHICDICWKSEFWKNVIKLHALKYQTGIGNKFSTGKSDWICRSCHKSILKNKVPMQAQKIKMELCPNFNKFEGLCLIELMLISQIIPFVFIVSKMKGAKHGLKGSSWSLVPTDLKKVQIIFPRSCDEESLISLALKRWLSDKSAVNKQQIYPAFFNRALGILIEINPFYKNVFVDNDWKNVSEQSDLEFWKFLINDNGKEFNIGDQTDSDDDIEGNN